VAWIAGADIRPLFAAADALLAVGTRFNQGMTHDWSVELPATTIRIDIDAEEIERNLPMQQKLVGDARSSLTAIESHLAEWDEDRQSHIPQPMAQALDHFRAALLAKAGSTLPWMNSLRSALPRDAIISADMSLFWADMLGTFPIYEPRTMMFPWGYGTLGFAVPEALGAKIALPHRDVIAIAGDGAFLFTGAELATAVQYQLNIPILIPNNNAYGMIKVQQRDQFDEQFMAVDLVNPDFIKLAEAFGAYGVKARTPEQMGDAISQALLADRPTIIEIPWSWTWGKEN
jgi:acetolactate synthase-1/2/3 large subunit